MITLKFIVGFIGLVLLAYSLLRLIDKTPKEDEEDTESDVSYDEMLTVLGDDLRNTKKREFFTLMNEYEEQRDAGRYDP